MASVTQTGRLLQFSCTGLPTDSLLIQSFEGEEAISRLFDFHVELLVPPGTTITSDELVGKNATITIQPLGTDNPRWINGIIASLEQSWNYAEFDTYTVRLVPALWQASLGSDCRCLQNMKPMEVIQEVLKPYSLSIADKTTGSSPDGKPFTAADYVTQFNESDLDFVNRIAEQHGIFYWFDHSQNGKHILTFADSRDGYASDKFPVEFSSQEGDHEVYYKPIVTEFRLTDAMAPGKHVKRDYDWRGHKLYEAPTVTSAQPGPGTKNAFEHYSYPSPGTAQFKALAKQPDPTAGGPASLEGQRNATDTGSKMYHGVSIARSLYPASTLSLDHPRPDWKSDFVITYMKHEGEQSPPYQSDGKDGGYGNGFDAIEATRLYVPEAATPKPRIVGLQSAVVVTPAGQDLAVDKNGRVCCRFLWTRQFKPDTLDNTWLRVSQQWGGSGWGTYFWPRKNDEVLVSFFNGDPDDPIIVGSAYNGVNIPKYSPSQMSTRSGILTRSSLEGSATTANELYFEDLKGSEEVHIHAEKDMNTMVENDNSRAVGANESIDISNNRNLHVRKNQTTNIDVNHTVVVGAESELSICGTHKELYAKNVDSTYQASLNEKIDGSHTLQISNGSDQKMGASLSLETGQAIHLKAGNLVVIEAGAMLTIKAGSNFISIDPAGIQIVGTMVLVNSGGTAFPGAPVVVTDPQLPQASCPIPTPGDPPNFKG